MSKKIRKKLISSITESPSVVDLSRIGPLDNCLRCFTPKNYEYGFCLTCGRLSGFLMPDFEPREKCYIHKNTLANKSCALCGLPICDLCVEREGFSLLGGFPTPQCKICVEKIEQLEKDFINEINSKNLCSKHRDRKASFRCVSCSLPHCDECVYFFLGGIFKKSIESGPYCLPCSRIHTVGKTWKREKGWISGYKAKKVGLI